MDNMFTEGMMQGPDGSILRFFYDSERNEVATQNTGRAIFDTVLFCDVITPGQKASTPRFELERVFSEQSREAANINVERKQTHKYKEYREFVEKFKQNEAQQDMGGTPLKMWPRIDRGMASTLFALNIFTVESLAALSDVNLQNIGLGARELRDQAKAWLEKAKGDEDTSRLVAEKARLEQELQRISADVSASNNRILELEAALARKSNTKSKLPDDII